MGVYVKSLDCSRVCQILWVVTQVKLSWMLYKPCWAQVLGCLIASWITIFSYLFLDEMWITIFSYLFLDEMWITTFSYLFLDEMVLGSVVAVAFQITFCAEMHANDVFLFLKNYF